jgi:DNA-binding transcriptional ArsR family regulator
MHKMNWTMHSFKIEERRSKVASLLAQSMTESEIAQELKVDQSTVSRDVQVLKQQSQRFVYDLAKSDLAFYYKQCIDGIEEVKRKAWEILRKSNDNNNDKNNNSLNEKDKLSTLKLIKECNEAKFSLFKDGPSVMNLNTLEERLTIIENRKAC